MNDCADGKFDVKAASKEEVANGLADRDQEAAQLTDGSDKQAYFVRLLAAHPNVGQVNGAR